jgi:hypothetical protein
MSVVKPIPSALRAWAQSIVGPARLVRDVSHDRPNSQEAIAWGLPNGDCEIVERGRATLARLEVQAA